MLRTRAIRSLFEARTREAQAHGTDLAGYRRGCVAFLEEFHDTFGVRFDRALGRPEFALDENGLPLRAQGCARAAECGVRMLAEAIMGHEFVQDFFHPAAGVDFGNMALLEGAIDPTAFVNISTFNLSVAGLVNAKILERFNAPEYIGREIVQIVPTNKNGDKFIGVTKYNPSTKAAKGRLPGEQHARVGFGEQYQTSPETVEQANAVEITKEAVYFDLTGQVLDQAGEVGDDLAYGQEKDIADLVLGVTSSHNWNGTSYATYQASSPWINDQSNPFADENDVDDARQLFVGMTDPATGREIMVNGLDILCMPARELRFREQLFGPNVEVGTQLNSNFPSRYKMSPNQINAVGRGTYTLTPLTAIWYNRATAADGLNLSASNAKEYWWVGDFKKAFYWMENWPMTPWQASASELYMKDRGLVAIYGANYRGVAYAKQPRYAVRNKN